MIFTGSFSPDKNIESLIGACAKIKAGVVESDELEGGLRKILNLGHTFGHSVESELNFRIPHGLSVAFGLICSLNLSAKLGLMDKDRCEELIKLPLRFSFPKKLSIVSIDNLLKHMRSDKKTVNSNPRFVLVKDIGTIALDVEAPPEIIKSSIISSLERINK